MPILSIGQLQAFEQLLQTVPDLVQRLAVVEARLTAEAQPTARLARVEAAEQLRAEIAGVLAAHHGPAKMTAKDVLRALEKRGTTCELSLRTVRWHMSEIRRDDH